MVTRLGLYGGPRGLYGSFASKTEQVTGGISTLFAGLGMGRMGIR